MTSPLWQPDRDQIESTQLYQLMKKLENKYDVSLPDYRAVFDWSLSAHENFWSEVWEFCGVIGEKGEAPFLVNADKMPGAQFFPAARLNYAENLLRRRDNSDALVFWAEDKIKRKLSWAELYDQVSRLRQSFITMGLKPGDRVAAFMPNMPETIVAMLATTSLGAVWSSCSPDFGHQGVVDRFGQIEPKILICPDGYYYNGKAFRTLDKVKGFVDELPTVEQTIVVPLLGEGLRQVNPRAAILWEDALAPYRAQEIDFERFQFNHPLFILYSSGTTGKPKCIVHGAGGTLLQHLKEHQLHCDIKPGDRVFFFTTCGWMMWNWLVSALASQACLLLYDGSPFAPSGHILFDYAQNEKATLFGTSAKFIDALNKNDISPIETHDLSSLRMVASTGSPLVAEGFDYVYENINNDICLASISGGTDIISCFVLGAPIRPVWRGEIQARGLGMAVEVWDENGNPVREEKGELVCTRPFPSMPIYFWDDPEGARYHAAYFEKYPGVWCHGDYVELSEHDGIIIYGRSDATLNPGGVRIGTAEIYRQVEKLAEIEESIVIGQDWHDDVRVVLFVKLRPGFKLDDDLITKIKSQIKAGCTPRHIPAKVIAVPDIPRTKSGKIVELAVRDVVHGRKVKNKEALANPEALQHFANISALQQQ